MIAFTDYAELRGRTAVTDNQLLKIKRLLLFPLRFRALGRFRLIKRGVLSLGCPICCPSVTFVKTNLTYPVFTAGFRSDEDWEAWEIISKRKGSFVYLHKVRMYHRIHEDSETSVILGEHARSKEDYQMFCKFWPRPVAKILVKWYAKSETSNQL